MAHRIIIPSLIALTLGGTLVFGVFRSQEGQEFAGSSFDGESPQEAGRVFQDVESYLLAHGFSQDGSARSLSGLRSAGDREVYFRGQTAGTRNIAIQMTIQNTAVHTSVCWELEGFSWQVKNARLRAFETAAGIDDCIAHRAERNLIPANLVEEQRRRFRNEIARNTR